MGRPRLVYALVSAGTLLASVPAVGASACEPFLQDRPALLEQSLTLRGGERVVRTVRVPAQTSVLVLVQEGDLDVSLEASLGGKVVGRADSPIERRTIQRLTFSTTASADYTIAVTGKQHGANSSAANVRIVGYPPTMSKDFCLGVHQKLALADGAFAAVNLLDQKSAAPAAPVSPLTVAAQNYAAAAQLLEKNGPSPLLAQVELAQATLSYYKTRDWQQAVAEARAAAATYTRLNDSYGVARAQVVEAEARLEVATAPPSGKAPSAADRDEELANLRRQLGSIAAFHSGRGERYEEGVALNDIGTSFYMAGLHDEAIPAFLRALSVFEQGKEQSSQALALQNTAMVEYELGRLSDASSHYARVLQLIRQEDDPTLFAIILNNSALAHWASGELDLALRQFNEALAVLRVTQDPFVLAAALHNTGCVYDALGDHERALDLYQQALALRTPQGDPRGRTASLRTIGNALRAQGKAPEALALHGEALTLASTAPMKLRIEVQIAKDLAALGRTDAALQRLNVVLREVGSSDDVTKARALAERGIQRGLRGESAPAAADLNEAQRIFHKNELPEDEFDAWVSLARLRRTRGAGEEALKALDRALALAEEVRVQSSNPELRATLLQPLRPAFDLKIELLAERYFAKGATEGVRQRTALAALATAEQARARALADFETFDVTAPGLSPELVARRQEIYRQLAARRFRLATYLERASGAEDPRLRTIRADIATLRQQLDEIDARIGAASDANAPRRGVGDRSSLDFRSLPQGVAVVEYWLGAEQVYAWAATRDGLVMKRLGSSSAITNAARALHTALRGFGAVPESQRLSLGEQLYGLVVAPLGAQVTSERKLVFALDGALHYVPFATLRMPDAGGAKFLIERHDVAVTPSIGMFLRTDRPRNKAAPVREMLLVADPVYELDDSRLASLAGGSAGPSPSSKAWPLSLFRASNGEGTLTRLPGTAKEAATIASLLPREGVDRLEGFTATRDRFLAAGLERYRFIHIASHAVNDSEIPQASALILSTIDQRSRPADGRVLAADFVNVQLNADTVVLSACDTALGKSVSGEGLIGLQYVVLARGAGSVVSSLWPVADQATAQLMAQFYSARLRGNAAVEAALADAMRAMLAGKLRDPGLWGAFAVTVARANGS
jgi:CHAT domain-containing protein